MKISLRAACVAALACFGCSSVLETSNAATSEQAQGVTRYVASFVVEAATPYEVQGNYFGMRGFDVVLATSGIEAPAGDYLQNRTLREHVSVGYWLDEPRITGLVESDNPDFPFATSLPGAEIRSQIQWELAPGTTSPPIEIEQAETLVTITESASVRDEAGVGDTYEPYGSVDGSATNPPVCCVEQRLVHIEDLPQIPQPGGTFIYYCENWQFIPLETTYEPGRACRPFNYTDQANEPELALEPATASRPNIRRLVPATSPNGKPPFAIDGYLQLGASSTETYGAAGRTMSVTLDYGATGLVRLGTEAAIALQQNGGPTKNITVRSNVDVVREGRNIKRFRVDLQLDHPLTGALVTALLQHDLTQAVTLAFVP